MYTAKWSNGGLWILLPNAAGAFLAHTVKVEPYLLAFLSLLCKLSYFGLRYILF